MSAPMLAIADGLVSALNAREWAEPYPAIGAARKLKPVYELAELDMLRVTVVPGPFTEALATREETGGRYTVDVGIQRRLGMLEGDADEGQIAELLALEADMVDYLLTLELEVPTGGAQAVSVEVNPPYDPVWLEQYGVFTGVVSVTFETLRTL